MSIPQRDRTSKANKNAREETIHVNGTGSPVDLDGLFDASKEGIAEARANLDGSGDQGAPERKYAPVNMFDLVNSPPKDWIIDQVAGRGDLGVIFGEAGSGKTFLVIDLIMSALLGRPWAGRFRVSGPLRVAFFAAEGRNGIGERFAAALEYYAAEPGDLDGFSYFQNVPRFGDVADLELLRAALKDAGITPDLVIIDTLSDASAGVNENDNAAMSEVMRGAESLAYDLGCAVFLTHHTGKNGEGFRGAMAIKDKSNVMIQVQKTGDNRIMSCYKLKDGGAEWDQQVFSLVAKGPAARVFWEAPGDVSGVSKKSDKVRAFEFLCARPGQRFNAAEVAEALSLGGKDPSKTASTYLGQLYRENTGVIDRAGSGSYVYFCKPESERG